MLFAMKLGEECALQCTVGTDDSSMRPQQNLVQIVRQKLLMTICDCRFSTNRNNQLLTNKDVCVWQETGKKQGTVAVVVRT